VIGRWDRDRLVQILDALCEVATRPVPADVQVRVQIVARNDAAQVTVTAPMAWSPLEHLQTLFHRSPRRSGMRRASYGPPSLWIATKLAEAHGGRLWAEVEDGQSAVLRLLLPYAPSAGGDEPLTRLTPRQLEIVALVAQGKTNREIAAALVLSQATVENHVDRILRRLGVRNRAAAASWAAEHGLARTSGG
jgi:DNA-binding CsgD family transcriptional regulator